MNTWSSKSCVRSENRNRHSLTDTNGMTIPK